MKPNFFIVGAPKAGTTSLYHYLEQHPEVFMSPIKETNFFSSADILKQQLYYQDKIVTSLDEYMSLFDLVGNEKSIGEASVSYLFYPEVAGRIFSFNPASKIIIVLRNPSDRAFSHYLMDRKLGFVSESFENIVLQKSKSPSSGLYFQQFIELGNYYEQVKIYLEKFGSSNVLILLYDDIKRKTRTWVEQVFQFLEVDSAFEADISLVHNTFREPKNILLKQLYKQKKLRDLAKNMIPSSISGNLSPFLFSNRKPSMKPYVRQFLSEYYFADIQQLEKLIGRRLDNWYCQQ